MKRFFAVFLCLLLTGCAGPKAAAPSESAAEDRPRAAAGVPSEDCLLCNGLDGTRYSYWWGQDNLALLSLNTGEVWPLEINRYELGELVETHAGYLSMLMFTSADGGFDASANIHIDRGFADGRVTLNGDAALDLDAAAERFCADCVNRALDGCLGAPCGVGVLHLGSGEVRLFDDRTLGFQLGDYYVANAAPDFLAFYCPERYPVS